MKYIYKLSLLVLAVFTFTACAIDDDDPVVSAERDLAIGLNRTGVISVPDNTTEYNLGVNFTDVIPELSRLFYTVDGVEQTLTLNSGASTATIPVTFTAAENVHEIVLTGFTIINGAAQNINAVLSSNTTATIAKQGAFIATITWPGSSDLDVGLQPMTATWADTFAWIDTSLGVTNTEVLEGSPLADGNYAIYFQYFGASAPEDVNVSMVTGAGILSTDINVTADGNAIWFTKETDANGNVSYTIFTQDPA
ncbi:hypothetical protein AAON49_00550 [Pseudotenacibaculum sp. MALMAid0570]|uniref:hypothetical protein n=1 Tax=Pseudotenacibaculum sp. MALMAid0570 TaxID=3143938 RepID=UPI0032DFC9A7